MKQRHRTSGLTMVELLVALFLASFVMVAVIQLLTVTLDMWTRGESRRTVIERTSSTLEMMAEDLRALEGGALGDLVCDWARFDLNGDNQPDRIWPRLRLVRQAGAPLMQRLTMRDLDPEQVAALDFEGLRPDTPPDPADPSGFVEVIWVVLPAGKESPYEGVLYRGERMLTDETRAAFLDPKYFGTGNLPAPGSIDEVSAGILWLGLEFATQTSVVREGWTVGSELADASASWDAWNRDRPNPEASLRNEAGRGMPRIDGEPLLPRRVRLTLELETENDVPTRTTLARIASAQDARLIVERGDQLPSDKDSHIWIEGEWMKVLEVRGNTVRVSRGARQTTARNLPAGAQVHFGRPVTTEVSIPLYKDDWNL
jgi:hypothetical protein